ncbi:MAG: carboxypeptidase-like regulatory domain-containing protein [Planctomycetaceae bacterium]|jgi:hypothetical protein
MAVRFQCKCGKKYKTTDDKIGKKILCTACGTAITVPESDTVEVEDVAASASASSLAGDLLKVASASSRKKADEDIPEEKPRTMTDDVAEAGMDLAKQVLPAVIGVTVLCVVIYFLSASVMSSGPKHPPLGDVSGVVTLDGAPLPNAEVVFRPIVGDQEGEQAASIGLTDAEGEYTLSYVKDVAGAAVGVHRVQIRARDENGREKVPVQFNDETTLNFEVKDGNNQADFALSVQ